MAFQVPSGATKIIDGATVVAASWTLVDATHGWLKILSPDRPVEFYVSCNKAHTLQFGVAGNTPASIAEVAVNDDYGRSGLADNTADGAKQYLFWPFAIGNAVCRLQNNDGAASATATIWAVQR